MTDPAVPLVILAPVAVAVGAAITALWARLSEVEKRERADCTERVAAVEARVEKLEQQRDDWQERWRREVERGARLYAIASLEAPKTSPELPPAPEWVEDTAMRDVRRNAELGAVLREYAQSERPEPYRPPQKSRPR